MNIVEVKLSLLTSGIDVDFSNLSNLYPNLKENFRVRRLKVSDRHFIKVSDEIRNWIPDEILLKNKNKNCVVKTYYTRDSPFILTADEDGFKIIPKKYFIKNNNWQENLFLRVLGEE